MRKRIHKLHILTIFCTALFLMPFLYGQGSNPTNNEQSRSSNTPVIKAKFIPDSILIGDLFTLEVEVSYDLMQVVFFPEFDNGMIGDIAEIVAQPDPDTLKNGRILTVTKKYTLQTFEEGVLSFGKFPMLYLDKNITDTIWSSDSLLLKVVFPEHDTTLTDIYDIREPLNAPFKAGEITGYASLALGFIALIAVAIWLLLRWRKRRPVKEDAARLLPAHVQAIQALEALHNRKLWQNNKHKQYYTGITDILREYIERRYMVHAPDMTSKEIIKAMSQRGLSEKAYRDLCDILRLADLVKFAKFQPQADTNEDIYTKSYYFVEETKIVETYTEPEDGL